MKKFDLARLKKDELKSIVVEWFNARGDLNIQKEGIGFSKFEILSEDVLVNNKSQTLAYDFNEDGAKLRTIIKQTKKGFTIKSDQYTDFNEISLDVYLSEKEVLFIMSEPSERQYIHLVFKD